MQVSRKFSKTFTVRAIADLAYCLSTFLVSLPGIHQQDVPRSIVVLAHILSVRRIFECPLTEKLTDDWVVCSLRGFLVIFDLAQIINVVWISFKTRFVDGFYLQNDSVLICFRSVFGRTPRDIREWTKPPDFQFAIY
jgi:hypothetical protein